jgi:hypothetical protein
MQKLSPTRPLHNRGREPARRCRKRPAGGAIGNVAAVGITALAPAFAQALPILDTVPEAYSHEFHAELLYDLCAALVREGLGRPETWRKSKESTVVFAQLVIMESIGEERWNLLRRNVGYHLTVSDTVDRDGPDTPLDDGRLAVTIECSECGFFKIGAAIAALEAEAEGLGAAFYWTLTYSLYRVMRIYNHDDALQYEERMREYANEDEGNPEQYEFPEVEKALPECIRKTLTCDGGHRAFLLKARRLLRKHRNGRYRSWIDHLRRIQVLSRIPSPADAYFREEGGYDDMPLPSLLVAFKEHDAIIACFDEEGQYMLEGSTEPAVGVVFSPQNDEEMRRALRVVGRFVGLNHELFQLVELIQEWEKRHGSTRVHRTEPSLRAT